jgi:uncharacterized coiled-coil protein SlyX
VRRKRQPYKNARCSIHELIRSEHNLFVLTHVGEIKSRMETERLIALETKIAHQEFAIDELQKAVHQQSLFIEKLEKHYRLLKESFDTALDPAPRDEKPPHY